MWVRESAILETLFDYLHVLHLPAVSESHPARALAEREDKRSLLQKIASFIHPAPESQDALMETLAEAEDKQVIGPDARLMLEGVIRMADRTAGDIMVATRRMDVLDINAPYEALLVQVIREAHSRFPVYEGERSNIIGMLLSKDLLKLQRSPTLNLRALLRPVHYVPETKGLYELLREFRSKHNHMSIVIDEFGAVAGLVTMEDVLEQIVGDIEDEFDAQADEGQADIFTLADGSYRVCGSATLESVAEAFGVDWSTVDAQVHDFETIGGWVTHRMGQLPTRGATWEASGLLFTVLHSKGGAVQWFQVQRQGAAAAE